MTRFVAVLGPEADEGAFQAMKEAARREGWRITEVGSRLWIATDRAVITRFPHASGEVLLIGEVASPSWPVITGKTVDALCRDLSDGLWGRYIALLLGPDQVLSGVFRDPSGAVDCAVSRSGSTWLAASDAPNWMIEATNDHPGLCWRTVAEVLRDPITLSSADLVSAWKTVPPGGLHLPDGRNRMIWSPAQAARRSSPADAAGLRATVEGAVTGLVGRRTSVLAEVSGGLDSAIMASSLLAGGFRGRVMWLNTSGPYTESDERAYARAVAETLGVELTIMSRSARDLVNGLALDHPRSLRPSLNRLDAVYDALQAGLCERHGVEGVLTGKGGDVAFVQTASSSILADQIRDRGLGALLTPTAPVLARRMRRSAWRTMRAALVAARRPRDYAPLANGLLHPDIRQMDVAPHPWLADVADLGPAKRQQVVGFTSNLGLHSPSLRNARADLLHPALSQPVMETVLAIPAYELTRGGHDRLMAREAFADRLPAALIQRRSKSELGGYYGRVLAANIDRLRPHLLEGYLARHGLIDREQVEAALQVEHLIWQGGYLELMMLSLVESWVSAWRS